MAVRDNKKINFIAINVLDAKEEPILHGKDVMPYVQPGPQMGALLKKVYEIQIEQGITDKDELLKYILDV